MIKLDVNSVNYGVHGLPGVVFKLLVVNYEQTKISFSISQGLFVVYINNIYLLTYIFERGQSDEIHYK